ncbi:MAG: hypothetical protein IH606_23705 [Burkholderiales bacterium]|nr:hypothetical protein [Burkholderiales bacterium]
MSQTKQIVRIAIAAAAFGTMINVQAAAAASTAAGAAIFQGDALAPFKLLAWAGGDGAKPYQTPSSDGAAHAASATGGHTQWFSRTSYSGRAQTGLDLLTGCADYPSCANKRLDKARLARSPGPAVSRKLSDNFSEAWAVDYAAPLSAFATLTGLWNRDGTASPEARHIAPDTSVESSLLHSVLSSLMWALLGYAVYLAALTLFQKRFVFNSSHAMRSASVPSDTHEITSVRLSLSRNKAIRGWFLRPRQGKSPCPSIIYYGGRSEEVSWLQGAVKWFPEHAVLFLNYRGYGESEGKPSEAGLFADGLAQFDWLAAQPGVDPDGIVLVGRSLGTGVASYVAANRPAARVVLITPYDSLLAVARRRFWFTPLSLLLRHKFRSVEYAKTNMQPCLALLAEHDDVVPEEHTLRLMAAWAGAKELVRIPSTNHINIPYQAATLTAVAIWLGYASAPAGPLSLVAHAT